MALIPVIFVVAADVAAYRWRGRVPDLCICLSFQKTMKRNYKAGFLLVSY